MNNSKLQNHAEIQILTLQTSVVPCDQTKYANDLAILFKSLAPVAVTK